MHRRTRKWLALVAGLLMVAVPLVTAGGARAAIRSVQAPAGLAPGQCADFTLQSFSSGDYPETGSGGIDFYDPNESDTTWCQELIPGSTSLVTIYTGGGDCLAFNATAKTFYLHDPTGCASGTVQYLVWRFIPEGFGYYLLQNQYDPSGRPCISATPIPATAENCDQTGDPSIYYDYIAE